MKCVKCNSEIESDAQFCPYCGKEVEQVKQCSKCGKPLDEDSDFCPYCGSKQCVATECSRAEEVKRSEDNCTSQEKTIQHTSSNDSGGSKKWLWVICSILLIGVLCGGGFYLASNKSDSFAQAADSMAISELQSVDGAKQRLTEILPKAFKMQDKEAIHAYFSKEYQELYDKVLEIDNTIYAGEIGFWNGNIWDGGQEGNPNSAEIIQINSSSDSNASAQLKFVLQEGDFKSENIVSMDLVFEDGDWRIADVGGYKGRMKEYVRSAQEYSDTGFYVADLMTLQESGDVSSANKLFTSNGYTSNGDGWVKGDMKISFDGKILRVEAKSADGSDPFPSDWGLELKELVNQGYKSEDTSVGMVSRTDYSKKGKALVSIGSAMETYVLSIGEQAEF